MRGRDPVHPRIRERAWRRVFAIHNWCSTAMDTILSSTRGMPTTIPMGATRASMPACASLAMTRWRTNLAGAAMCLGIRKSRCFRFL